VTASTTVLIRHHKMLLKLKEFLIKSIIMSENTITLFGKA
jgi:hypothetical protein